MNCPKCGRELHSIAEGGEYQGLYQCFNGPRYYREKGGELVDVTDRYVHSDTDKEEQ